MGFFEQRRIAPVLFSGGKPAPGSGTLLHGILRFHFPWMQFLFIRRGSVVPRAGAVPVCRCSPDRYFHTAAHRHGAFGRHLSPTGYFKLYPPKNLSTCPLQITSVYLKNPCSLSLTDYLRFYPQNVNFVPGNYLDCTGMKIQWATFTLSPICSFWP